MKNITISLIFILHAFENIKAQNIQFNYDNVGRLLKIIYANQKTISYTYDKDGNRLVSQLAAVALPLELLSFTAQKQGTEVLLLWSTARENNSDKFDVEFSKDGLLFQSFTTVAAKGTTSAKTDYSTVHCCPIEGINYYRLKMINKDGTFKYSDIRTVTFEFINVMSVYPNPISHQAGLTISFIKPFMKDAIVNIYNSAGAILYSSLLPTGAISLQINISTFAVGAYFIVVTVEGEKYKEKLVKQ